MSSLGVKLPLNYSSADGFGMLKSIKQTIRQNLKMIILTSPGERVMEPEFGVGLRQFLFLNYSEKVEQQIRSKIKKQIAIYLPVITITNMRFESAQDYNSLSLSIEYSIPDIALTDLLEFTI